MNRSTERAYIKGLNEGYALAKAQYENRRAILYNLPDICTCGECGFITNKKNSELPIPNFCIKCGCRFDTVQNMSYPLDEGFEQANMHVQL